MKTTHCIFRTMAAVVATLPMTFALLTSCSEEEDGQATLKEEVVFSTSVTQAPVSRAEVPYEGSLTLAYGSLSATQQASYLYKDNTWTCTSTAPLYWQDLVPADGKYTFFALAPSAERGEVASDQSAEADFTASDWMVARTEATAIGALNFSLKHVLSQVMVRVLTTEGKEALTDAELASTTVTLNGLKCAYSVAEGTSADVPAVATASGTAANGLKPLKTENIHRFIVPAQALEAGKLTMEFDVTIGSQVRTYIYTADAVTLSAGTVKQYDITLSRTEATLTAVKVTEWTTGTTTTGKLGLAISGDAATIEGEDPAFTTMSLWTGQAEIADNAVATAKAYTLTGTAWGTATDVTPFYLDDCLESTFYALAENSAADAVTGLTDLVAAGPASIQGGKLGLEFKHLLALLTVNVTEVEGFPADLTGCKVTLKKGLLPTYTLSYAADGTLQATASGEAKDYTFTPATATIVAPQTVKAGTDFVLTLADGKTYSGSLEKDLVLNAATTNKLMLTLGPTGISLAAAVKDWTEGTAIEQEQVLTIDITGTPDTPQGSATTFTKFYLELAEAPVKNFDSSSGLRLGTMHTYEYADGAWSSTNPIFLDELTETSVIYATVYNADASGVDILDEVTNLPDALVAGPVAIKGGTAAIEFRHALAQLTVKLTKGTDFTPDLAGAVVTTPAMAKGATINTDANGLLFFAAGSTTTTYTIADDEAHLVVPQTLAQGSVFSVKLTNGHTYTAKLTQDVNLEAGKNTTLTLTLTPTTVGLKTTVADWGTATASAEVHLDGLTDGSVAVTASEGDQLTVTYAKDNLTAVYTYTGGQWTSTAPLYWDDINREGFTGEFSAVYICNTTPVKDQLTGTATGVTYGNELNFNLEQHTTAKLTFTFKGGEGVTEDDIKGFTKTITLSGTDYTIAGDMHFAPYTLTDTDVITLTRPNGNTYIVKLKDLKNGTADLFTNSKLEAGKHYAITLTVNETSVGIQASIAAWTEVTGSGTMTPDFTNP